jgi:hypothetical protein
MNWIPVTERLPATEEPVLVCECDHTGKLQVTTLAFYRKKTPWVTDSNEMEWAVAANCGGYEVEPDECNPTHWMPLPEPPAA